MKDQTQPLPIRQRLPAFMQAVLNGEVRSMWSQPPATGPDLLAYARRGQWCAPESTGWRLAGKTYCYAVAIPFSMTAYGAAWVMQRPGRGAAIALLGFVLWLLA